MEQPEQKQMVCVRLRWEMRLEITGKYHLMLDSDKPKNLDLIL